MEDTVRSSLAEYIADCQYRYYYSMLSKALQDAYDKLLEGYMSHKSSIDIMVAEIDEVWLIHRQLCFDVPELFFIKTISGSFDSSSSTATVYPEYRFDHETCCSILRQMEKKTKRLIQKTAVLPEQEKVKRIHDYIIQNVTYKDAKAPYSHESFGVLIYGIGVCEGISKTFKYVADRVGLNSIVIAGKAKPDPNPLTNTAGHAWNIVYVEACPYHLDVTYDYAVSGGTVRYDYFLLSDRQIQADHSFEGTPSCSDSYEFYSVNGHYVDNAKHLQLLAKNELKPGIPLVVKVPVFTEISERVAEKLVETVIAAIPRYYSIQASVSMSYNRFRMILQFVLRE